METVTEEVTETVETPATETKAEESVTFTQEQVNELVKERLARAKKDVPSKEELAKYKEWQEAQKTEVEKQAEIVKELETLKMEKENTQKENKILKAGVKEEDAEYVLFKVGKMEGEFAENLENFLKDNPKYLGEEPKTNGVATATTSAVKEDGVTAILKAKHPELYR